MLDLEKLPKELGFRYIQSIHEINEFRRKGRELREKVKADPVRHGHLMTRELHPVEMEVLKYLNPELAQTDSKLKQKAWMKFLRKNEDYRASPYAKRYY